MASIQQQQSQRGPAVAGTGGLAFGTVNAAGPAESGGSGPAAHFNGAECSRFLSKGWAAMLDNIHNPRIPPAEKPEIYKSTTGGWSGTGTSWASKGNVTQNGQDFLTQLLKQLPPPSTQAPPGNAPENGEQKPSS